MFQVVFSSSLQHHRSSLSRSIYISISINLQSCLFPRTPHPSLLFNIRLPSPTQNIQLEDCSLPLLKGVVATADPAEAFAGADAAILVGAMPRYAICVHCGVIFILWWCCEVRGVLVCRHVFFMGGGRVHWSTGSVWNCECFVCFFVHTILY